MITQRELTTIFEFPQLYFLFLRVRIAIPPWFFLPLAKRQPRSASAISDVPSSHGKGFPPNQFLYGYISIRPLNHLDNAFCAAKFRFPIAFICPGNEMSRRRELDKLVFFSTLFPVTKNLRTPKELDRVCYI